MALNLKPPSQGIGTAEDKLRSLYSYLFQLTEELNQALTNVESTGRDGISRVISGGKGGGSSKVDKSTAEAYQQLKSLIIKTATDVTSSMRKIVTEMTAEYRAQSEFGTYEEYLNNRITQSAEGYLLEWDAQQGISTGVADFKEYKADSDVYMKIGIVGYNDDGTVEAGVVVGRDLQKVTIDGKEKLISENVYSLLKADGLSLWKNGAKLTEVSLSGFFGEKAYINEITTKLIHDEELGAEIAFENGGLIRGIAQKIDLSANDSIKLAVSNSVSTLGIVGDNLLKLSGETISNSNTVVATYEFGDVKPKKGETYTVRLWIESASGTMPAISAYGLGTDGVNPGWGKPTEAEDGSYVYTGEWTMDEVIGFAISQPFTNRKTLTIYRIKLEHGDKPTAWIPHRAEFKAGTVLELDERGLNMTGGEIRMVTRDDDGNQTGAVVIDENGVQATGGMIRMTTRDEAGNETGAVLVDEEGLRATGGRIEMQSVKDGEQVGGVTMDPDGFRVQGVAISLTTGDDDAAEYINITDDGVAASSVSAPNVAVRYDGPNTILVNKATPLENQTDPAFATTLHEVFERLRGKVLDFDLTINVLNDDTNIQYGDHRLRGVSGSGKITIKPFVSSGSNWKLYGTLGFQYLSVPVYIMDMEIVSDTNAVSVEHSSVSLVNCSVKLNSTGIYGSYGITASRGSDVVLNNCTTAGFTYAYMAATGGNLTSNGSITDSQVSVSGGILYIMDHTAFGIETWNPSVTAGAVYTSGLNVISTSPSVKPSEPMPTTVTAQTTETKSYTGSGWRSDSEIRQGLYGSTNYVGCMWFDTSGFRGEKLTSATLTLTRVNNTGRGGEVTLHLYAITATSTGNPTSGFVDCGVIGKIGSGETRSFSILEAAQLLANGTYRGLALFEAGATKMSGKEYSSNYCRIDSSSPKLTVTY